MTVPRALRGERGISQATRQCIRLHSGYSNHSASGYHGLATVR
ncbi:hypothetical protein [Geminisphaera colitermitum]|nr:hypothetical protein [Geminisphaera colitermitum]